MEAAMVNLTAPGDSILVVKGGKFGERWEKLGKAYACEVTTLTFENGAAAEPQKVLEAARNVRPKALFMQANETSTGVYNPVEEIARTLRSGGYDGLLIVDAISSLGAHEMRMDEWKIDAVVAGSQKGFGLPPGLSFIALGQRAWSMLSERPRFYFDLARERKGQEVEGRSAWTPAHSLVLALDVALTEIERLGPGGFPAHHARLAEAARRAMAAVNLPLFPKTHPSNALTTFTVPAGLDGGRLLKRIRGRFGMFFAGGQDELKGKIVRFAHLGFVSRFDLLDGLAALEFALHEEGHAFTLGAGVQAAMQRLANP